VLGGGIKVFGIAIEWCVVILLDGVDVFTTERQPAVDGWNEVGLVFLPGARVFQRRNLPSESTIGSVIDSVFGRCVSLHLLFLTICTGSANVFMAQVSLLIVFLLKSQAALPPPERDPTRHIWDAVQSLARLFSSLLCYTNPASGSSS
jgi:ascorbate-specific PTS system EIIC-type component UlaA